MTTPLLPEQIELHRDRTWRREIENENWDLACDLILN
jgi:hypothetical protein